MSARVILEAKKCFDWTVEGAGGSVGEHNKMKVSVKSESEVSAGRVCYKMEIYSEENEGKRYNIQIYIESESGICQESEGRYQSLPLGSKSSIFA